VLSISKIHVYAKSVAHIKHSKVSKRVKSVLVANNEVL